MSIRLLTVLTTLVFLVGLSRAAEEQMHEQSSQESDMDKRSLMDAYYVPQRSANWISSRPIKSLNSAANEDIGYLLQYLNKRSGELNDDLESERSIRSPLGTMRFGKRAASPLQTMRFGKKRSSPLQTMRFGRR